MKRTIVCPDCVPEPPPPDPLSPSEWMRSVKGKARVQFVCDACGGKINAGCDAVAVSSGINEHGYFHWEPDYLVTEAANV